MILSKEQPSVYADRSSEKLTKKGDCPLMHVLFWPKMIAGPKPQPKACLQLGSRWRLIAAASDAQDAAVAYRPRDSKYGKGEHESLVNRVVIGLRLIGFKLSEQF